MVLNCFLLNARFLVFIYICSNTKPTIELFLHSMRINKSSENLTANHTAILEKHYLRWTCMCYSNRCIILNFVSFYFYVALKLNKIKYVVFTELK